jgi:hypothetical protein
MGSSTFVVTVKICFSEPPPPKTVTSYVDDPYDGPDLTVSDKLYLIKASNSQVSDRRKQNLLWVRGDKSKLCNWNVYFAI